ncbi:GL24228 [Drosophila persimilis]|uniref:GL24228 n=1 Tax=Drosophila persimilis TaxID=7234 RepID=B4G4R8_DROPE|nr:GL24228 [Drosophila persimilis]
MASGQRLQYSGVWCDGKTDKTRSREWEWGLLHLCLYQPREPPGWCLPPSCCSRPRSTLGRITTEYSELGAGSSYSTRRRDASPGWKHVSGTGWQLGLRVLEGLIKTGQSRNLAKDVPCIPPATTDSPNVPLPVSSKNIPSWANSLKPRNIAMHAMKRLLFWTDVGSHQAIIPSRPTDTHCRLGGFVYWLDDKTGIERITVNGERRSVEMHRLSQFTDIRAVWTFPQLHSQRASLQLTAEGSDRALICHGTTFDNCDNVHDEADCCKRPEDFQCPINKTQSKSVVHHPLDWSPSAKRQTLHKRRADGNSHAIGLEENRFRSDNNKSNQAQQQQPAAAEVDVTPPSEASEDSDDSGVSWDELSSVPPCPIPLAAISTIATKSIQIKATKRIPIPCVATFLSGCPFSSRTLYVLLCGHQSFPFGRLRFFCRIHSNICCASYFDNVVDKLEKKREYDGPSQDPHPVGAVGSPDDDDRWLRGRWLEISVCLQADFFHIRNTLRNHLTGRHFIRYSGKENSYDSN